MRKQLRSVIFLKLDHPLVEDGSSFHRPLPIVRELVAVFDAVGCAEPPAVKQVKVDIDTPHLQFRDEIVDSVQGIRVELLACATAVVNQRIPAIAEGVQAKHIDVILGQPCSDDASLVLLRCTIKAAHVRNEESRSRAVLEIYCS